MANGQIFVSIASYRDNQCQYTLQDLFRKAKYPDRVIAGVCFQVAKIDEDNFLLDLDLWSNQIRSHFLEHSEAKGPCYARKLVQDLYRGEEFYFQIDSHMRFVPDWDVLCIDQLRRCGPKAILTTYASSYTLPKSYRAGAADCAELIPNKALPILCADGFGDANQDDPFLRIKTRSCREDFATPPPALFWTARFAFSTGQVVEEVPYDPHLEYVFFGEEISMSARLWTAGWDFFHPTCEIAYHLASRAHRYWFREVQTSSDQVAREKKGKFRICGMLGIPWPQHAPHAPPEKPYGLGSQRTLADYEGFAGVSFASCSLQPHARLGGQPAHVFAPLWADEQREKMLLSNQLKDVESWAGKGNVSEANLDFVQKVQGYNASDSHREAQMRDVARMRVELLLAKLPGAQVELELCKAFSNLAQLDPSSAAGALAQSAHYLSLAKAADSTALWEASTKAAEASLRMAQQDFEASKAILLKALEDVTDALETQEALQVTYDIVEAIHRTHERTDDRQGLQKYHGALKAMLEALRRLSPEKCSDVPSLTAACPPPEGEAPNVLAMVLERVVLVLVATGQEKDLELVKSIYQCFRVARESPPLLRLLAMLQSSGHLLK